MKIMYWKINLLNIVSMRYTLYLNLCLIMKYALLKNIPKYTLRNYSSMKLYYLIGITKICHLTAVLQLLFGHQRRKNKLKDLSDPLLFPYSIKTTAWGKENIIYLCGPMLCQATNGLQLPQASLTILTFKLLIL